MKNYLVKSLYQIANPDWHVLDRRHETNLFEQYMELHEMSLDSFNQHLKGDWELKFFTGEFHDINQAFESTFWAIHDLWHQEPCNILYTDPDTLAVQPVDVFGKFPNFMMFNHTDPRTFDRDGIVFEHFFNAGVRYFPSTMSEETWKLGADMARNWNYNSYDTEQIILNAMLWSQGLDVQQVHHPKLNWMAMSLRNMDPAWMSAHSAWNLFPIESAEIIHFHSSRGAQAVKQIMELVKSSVLFRA